MAGFRWLARSAAEHGRAVCGNARSLSVSREPADSRFSACSSKTRRSGGISELSPEPGQAEFTGQLPAGLPGQPLVERSRLHQPIPFRVSKGELFEGLRMVWISGQALLPDLHRGIGAAGTVEADAEQEVVFRLQGILAQSGEQRVRRRITTETGRGTRQQPKSRRSSGFLVSSRLLSSAARA